VIDSHAVTPVRVPITRIRVPAAIQL